MNSTCESSLQCFSEAFLEPLGVISLVAATFGIIFNILNIIVLCHPKMRNSVNLLLTMLAACELTLLIFYIPYVAIFNLGRDKHENVPRFYTKNIHEARFLVFYSDVSVSLHFSATWLIITTACFRFIYVQFPLKSAKICSYKRAIIAAVSTMLACLFISIPSIMLNAIQEYPCEHYPNPAVCSRNETYYFLANMQVYTRDLEHTKFWLFAIFGKWLPAILLLIFTIFLVRVLREANQRKKRLHSDAGISRHLQQSQPANEHTQTARMLLAVVVLFFLIEFPHGILLVYTAVTMDYQTYQHFGEVIDLATVIAFSLNLILYSAMSRQYRKLFIETTFQSLKTKIRLTKFSAQYKKCSCSGRDKR